MVNKSHQDGILFVTTGDQVFDIHRLDTNALGFGGRVVGVVCDDEYGYADPV